MIKHIARGLLATVLLGSAGTAIASPSDMGPTRMVTDSNAFYDDFHGPFYNGYWSAAGEYFFSTGPGRPYVRDDGHHFSRVMNAGFRPVEGVLRERSSEATASR